MIVFINGAFGVGKTTVAKRLLDHLPNSLLFDPEEVGFFLRNVLGSIDPVEDFQDYPLWRSLVVTTALSLRQTYGRTLVMPMTLWYPPYFEEVVGALQNGEPAFHHYCLTAPVETIHQRLRQRGDGPGGWAWVRAQRCCDAFQSSNFDRRIPAESASPSDILRTIVADLSSATP